MAVAGRVAPVPKGDYDKNVAYKRLDCVKYLNVLYIAKKDVPSGTAITDENYWMKGIEGSDGGGSAVIDDTQSSTLTTYSSNKLDTLVYDINQSVEATNTNVDNIQKTVSDINNSLDHKINSDGNVSETVVNTLDSIPEERILPTVGDKIKVMFAKTVKYFQDLKTIAFTGDYEDLINKPTIPTLTNNLLATETGTALDAAQGTVVKSEIDSLKSGLANLEEDVSTLNSDYTMDLSDGAGTAVLTVCGKLCLLTFNGHPVDTEIGSFKSLANLVPEKYRPKRYYAYSDIFALFNNKYYMVYTGFAPSGGWSGYGVSTSSDGYIYLTGRSLWNGTVMWLC